MIEKFGERYTVDVIGRFDGQYDFLSNFYEEAFEYDGHIFKTAEHAYQAQKTIDDVDFEKVKNADTPGQAKSYTIAGTGMILSLMLCIKLFLRNFLAVRNSRRN